MWEILMAMKLPPGEGLNSTLQNGDDWGMFAILSPYNGHYVWTHKAKVCWCVSSLS